MKATIKDVARAAGVSFKSVSRVVNNEPSTSPRIREKVNKAIKDLNYHPNLSARQMRGGSSSIGLIYDNPNSNYVIEMQNGILDECRKRGFELVIHPCDSKSTKLSEELAEMVKRGRVGGLVLTPPISEMTRVIEVLRDNKVKHVRVVSGVQAPDDQAPCVFINDQGAAQNITQYLIELGHKRICFLCGNREHKSNSERLEGYKAALAQNSIPADSELIIEGTFEFESGVSRAAKILEESVYPSAIIGCNDEIAAGALFAAQRLNIIVPQELSIVGFEDSPFSRHNWPKLTTARQSNEDIALRAASLLINEIRPHPSDDTGEKFVDIHPYLVIRGSTCPPAPAGKQQRVL